MLKSQQSLKQRKLTSPSNTTLPKPTKLTRKSSKSSQLSQTTPQHASKRTYFQDPLAAAGTRRGSRTTRGGLFDPNIDDLLNDGPQSSQHQQQQPTFQQNSPQQSTQGRYARQTPTPGFNDSIADFDTHFQPSSSSQSQQKATPQPQKKKASKLLSEIPTQFISPESKRTTQASNIPEPNQADLEIVESIEQYNAWLGQKMSIPMLTGLQSLFIANGMAKPTHTVQSLYKDVSTTSHENIPPQTLHEHLISTLIAHNIVVPQDDVRDTLISDIKKKKKEPFVLEFLKTLRLFGLFGDEFLTRYKPGFVNPNIKYTPGQSTTDPYNITLEVPDIEEHDTESLSTSKRTITVIDTMIDCLRLAGAFDVLTINPKTMKKMSMLVPPPVGESAQSSFRSTKLQKYDRKHHKNHQCTVATTQWYENYVQNETNLEKLQQIHAQNFRYDVTFSFRRKHESVYNKVMTFNYETLVRDNLGADNDELIEKYAPTKADLQLFKTQLLFNENLQTRLYHTYLRTPGAQQYLSIFIDDHLNDLKAEKATIDIELKYRKGLYNKLYYLTHLEDYPDTYNWDLSTNIHTYYNTTAISNENDTLSNPLFVAPTLASRMKTKTMLKNGNKKYMVLPPNQIFKESSVEKFFYLLVANDVIQPPPANYSGTINEWLLDCFVNDLKIFKKLTSNPQLIEQEKAEAQRLQDAEKPISAADLINTPHFATETNSNMTDKGLQTRNGIPTQYIYVPRVRNPQNHNELISIDLEENELLELLVEMDVIENDQIGSYLPHTNTPLLLQTDSPIQRQIKLKYLNQTNPPIPVKKMLVSLQNDHENSMGEQHPSELIAINGNEKTLENGTIERTEYVSQEMYDNNASNMIRADDHADSPQGMVAVRKHYREHWLTKRNPPMTRQLIRTLIDAQELQAEEQQEAIENLDEDGYTPTQIAATRPRVIYNKDSQQQQQQHQQQHQQQQQLAPLLFIPHDAKNGGKSVSMQGYLRSIENDIALTEGTKEIALFDEMINLLDCFSDFQKIQELMIQYYHHGIMVDFQVKYPNLFTKLTSPPSTYHSDKKDENGNTIKSPLAKTELILLQNPQFTPQEMDLIRWTISSLHVQYHLNQQYYFNQQAQQEDSSSILFQSMLLPPPTAGIAEIFGMDIASKILASPKSSLDIMQQYYINAVFPKYKENNLNVEDNAIKNVTTPKS